MEKRLLPNIRYLRYVVSIDSKAHLRGILAVSSPEEIRTILELVANILEGKFAARIKDLQNLQKYKGKLRNLWDIKTDVDTKKAELCKSVRAIQLVLIASESFIQGLTHF